jgi:lipopolysaccharide heptosyltransferase II
MVLLVLRPREFKRILLIKPSALGDVVHTLPVLVKLRKRYPTARIDWLVTPENAELVRHHPALSNVVLFARRHYTSFGRSWKATAGVFDLLRKLWRAHYDLVIDLHGQFRSAVLTLATGAPVRLGFARSMKQGSGTGSRGQGSEEEQKSEIRDRPLEEAQSDDRRNELSSLTPDPWPLAPVLRHGWTGAREGAWMAYSDHIPIPTLDVHAIDRYLWLAPILGLDAEPPDSRIHLTPGIDARVNELLGRHDLLTRQFAVLVPGTVWQTKHWTVEGFGQVANHLLAKDLAVILVGSARDQARCRAVQAISPQSQDLSGQTTLAELTEILRRAIIVVTNDSGPMHLAVALGKPVVSVFGPTNPVWVGPYQRPEAVLRVPLPCSPCYLRKLRHCRHDHACMKEMSGQTVIERMEKILSAGARIVSRAG